MASETERALFRPREIEGEGFEQVQRLAFIKEGGLWIFGAMLPVQVRVMGDEVGRGRGVNWWIWELVES